VATTKSYTHKLKTITKHKEHLWAVIFPLMEIEIEMEMIFLQQWKVRMEMN